MRMRTLLGEPPRSDMGVVMTDRINGQREFPRLAHRCTVSIERTKNVTAVRTAPKSYPQAGRFWVAQSRGDVFGAGVEKSFRGTTEVPRYSILTAMPIESDWAHLVRDHGEEER
jgi:hypothetical protein